MANSLISKHILQRRVQTREGAFFSKGYRVFNSLKDLLVHLFPRRLGQVSLLLQPRREAGDGIFLLPLFYFLRRPAVGGAFNLGVRPPAVGFALDEGRA